MHKSLILLLIGLISGFSIMISGNTLNYWLAREGMNIKTIGIFALVSLPYAMNFMWAPLFDRYNIKFLSKKIGQKLSWICVIQFFLATSIIITSYINPIPNLLYFAVSSCFIAFFASSQDCLLGALKTEILSTTEQGKLAGIWIFGYRIGMLISGSLAIYLSNFLSFSAIYKYFAVFIIFFGGLLILLIKNANISPKPTEYRKYSNFITSILKPVGTLKFLTIVVIFLILYRLPDNFLSVMTNPFLIKLGFTASEIAGAGKFTGIMSAIIGGFLGSFFMRNQNILKSLFVFGTIHAFAHILFIIQDIYGNNLSLLYFVITCENITGGMAMAAYITFIASLCKGQFRATQYSFFTAMMGASRSIFPSVSGYIVSTQGWKIFFIISILASIPPLFLLFYLKKYQTLMDMPND